MRNFLGSKKIRSKVFSHDFSLTRGTHPEVFRKKAVLKSLGKFTGQHLHRSGLQIDFIKKETPIQMFPREVCETFKNTCSEEHFRVS